MGGRPLGSGSPLASGGGEGRNPRPISPAASINHQSPTSEDPAVHVKALQKLFEQGATQIIVHAGQHDQQRMIDFYGTQVLPQLRSAGVIGARS